MRDMPMAEGDGLAKVLEVRDALAAVQAGELPEADLIVELMAVEPPAAPS